MKVVIAYDGSIHASTAVDDLQWAGLPPSSEAIVVPVIDEGILGARTLGMVEPDFVGEKIATAEKWAEEACDRLANYFPRWQILMETRWGNPAEVLIEKSAAWPADLIVVGSHGRSKLGRVLLGSVSAKLVREAPCSVRVGRSSNHGGPGRLLIGNDGSSESAAAVDEVCRRLWTPRTEVRVLAVHELVTPGNAERIATGQESNRVVDAQERLFLSQSLEESVQKLRQAGLTVSSVIEQGDPSTALIEAAKTWNANTIFMGARGLGRIARLLLGSVSSATVNHAPCTVEVVRRP
jgi:nucleotide-binding universal stress UspA family protein